MLSLLFSFGINADAEKKNYTVSDFANSTRPGTSAYLTIVHHIW
jgi:hypothetical protein